MRIYEAGEEINRELGRFINDGIASGDIRADIQPMPTAYILWSNISSLFYLARSKDSFMQREFEGSIDSFIEYGLKQIINFILVECV